MTAQTFSAGLRPDRAILQVAGPEARHFLHTLLTTGIEGMPPGAARYGALLTPQGKILFDLFVLDDGESFLIDCAAAQQADLIRRLALYKLRANLTITARPELAVAVSASAGTWADPRTPDLGYRSVVPTGSLPISEDYDSLRIALGLADSVADLGSGEFFPHEANLDQWGGVSFSKGCYVGQEVVSRMEHRGTARARILPVRLSNAAPPKGSDIRAGGKQMGTLLSSSGNRALALIRLDRLAEASSQLLTGDVTVTVLKPRWARYDVPGAEDKA